MTGPAGRILVVEDDPEAASFVIQVLGVRGNFDVTHTADPVAALLRASTESWDLLLTDVEMPGMTGIELLESLRRVAPDLPVAIMTAHASVGNAIGALRSRADEFLQKPLRPAQLTATVTRLVAKGRAERSLRREVVLADDQDHRPRGHRGGADDDLYPFGPRRPPGPPQHPPGRHGGRPSGRPGLLLPVAVATVDFRPTRFVRIDGQLEAKLEAIEAFGSQVAVRAYLEPDLISATARYWSRFGDGRFAEAFEVIRDGVAVQARSPVGLQAGEVAVAAFAEAVAAFAETADESSVLAGESDDCG